MARVRRSTNFGSRDGRRSLKARTEPYWLVLDRGLSLGYRKSGEGGTWVARRYDAARRRHAETRIATADDYRDADGSEVLDFGQAQRKALEAAKVDAEQVSGKRYTLANAVADYTSYLETHRKGTDGGAKLTAYLPATLLEKRVADLKATELDNWLADALKKPSNRKPKAPKPPRKRRRKGDAASLEQENKSDKPKPEYVAEKLRRRKSTLNRVIASLKACLNYAYATKRVASREAWARLKKFRAVDSARLRWLTVEEAGRLLNAAPSDLGALIRGALLTGCREGELLSACVRDYDGASGTLLIPDSKSGKPRRIPLTDEGKALLKALSTGKLEDAKLFVRADGSPWYRMAVLREMQTACKGANVGGAVSFYTLRHTYASLLVQAGTPLLFVAAALGHSDTRMVEKHYAHLAPSQVADTIRANLPIFDSKAMPKAGKSNKARVSDIRDRRRRN